MVTAGKVQALIVAKRGRRIPKHQFGCRLVITIMGAASQWEREAIGEKNAGRTPTRMAQARARR